MKILSKEALLIENYDNKDLKYWIKFNKVFKEDLYRDNRIKVEEGHYRFVRMEYPGLLSWSAIESGTCYSIDDIIIKLKENQAIVIVNVFDNSVGEELLKAINDNNVRAYGAFVWPASSVGPHLLSVDLLVGDKSEKFI